MKVCVIGTGPSGLTTIKQLVDEGHQVSCFEKNDNIGGIWYRHAGDDGETKAFDNLILTISIKLMSFSDFIFEGERIFYTREKYYRYLQAYADKFDLRKHISFRSTVTAVRRAPEGGYRVSVSSGADGGTSEHRFDAIALCSGPFATPNMNIPDLDRFTGEVLHSSRYRNNQTFRGKRVLVVGLAESGADILREVSDVSTQCTLSVRSYSFLIPRLVSGVHSTDSLTTRAHHYEMYVRSQDVPYRMKAIFGDGPAERLVFSGFAKLYGVAAALWNKVAGAVAAAAGRAAPVRETNNMGEPTLPLKMDFATEWTQENMEAIEEWNRRSHNGQGNWSQKIIFSKNVCFIPNIVNGRIDVKDCGIRRIDGKEVHFADGTVKEVDAIVLCTGFVRDFSVLGKDIDVKDGNVRNMYKHAFDPRHEGRLAWIGFVRPFSGGIPICAEMQARYFALLCSNKLKLPSDVDTRIRQDKEWEETYTAFSPNHTEAIPSQVMFCDSLAREIGCLMPVTALVRYPRLFVKHWFYAFNQACYRLTGPHSMRDAALKELREDGPGGLGSPRAMVLFTALTMLPRRVHPKDVRAPNKAPPGPYRDAWHSLKPAPAHGSGPREAPGRPEQSPRPVMEVEDRTRHRATK